ncbi:hypothetical protein M438DRAFT_363583 [Aureobasidium pullulans EXF-150]|uniref:BTB domain-containing protein n=1 Tax=Aureobasidium pullulans EXF-150 TaxID=1043002 RepID=A0A074YHN9_AURPU|nr:uncharacterized protein M438DRAFT_363583 [Aureobasidium pullulans EXF-150]KEQ86391.1 hypothetical protein M438DRAFT_363583 [Aureobasidium pullulans EXF-150]
MMLNAPSETHPGPSDMTLRLDNGEVIYAHKRILSQQSLVFKAAFLGGFADVTEYGIEDHEPETVYTMIKHIYGPHNDAEFQAKPSQELLKIYLIADEYQITSLSKRVTDIVWKRLDEKSVDDACVDLFEPIVNHTMLSLGMIRVRILDGFLDCWRRDSEEVYRRRRHFDEVFGIARYVFRTDIAISASNAGRPASP